MAYHSVSCRGTHCRTFPSPCRLRCPPRTNLVPPPPLPPPPLPPPRLKKTVSLWRSRFASALAGADARVWPHAAIPQDLRRSWPRPPETPPPPRTEPRSMAKRGRQQPRAACGGHGLKPHLVSASKSPTIPVRREAVDVVGLYLIRPSTRSCCAWTRSLDPGARSHAEEPADLSRPRRHHDA